MADAGASPRPGRPCPACGAAVPDGFRFCGGCGKRLSVRTAEPGTSAPPGEAVPPATRGRSVRRRLVAAVLVVAVALGAAAVLRGVDEPPPLTAAARGDAAGTGVFEDPGPLDLQHRRWRDRWTQAAPRDRLPPIRPVAAGDGYVVAVDGAVARLGASDGDIRWRVELDVDGLTPPLVVDDRFVVVSGADELTLLDLVDGARVWSAPVPELTGSRGLAVAGPTVAATGENGTVVLLDLLSGTRTATLLAREVLGERGPFTSDLGPVAVGDAFAVHLRRALEETGTIVLLSREGDVRWVSPEPVRPWTPPVVGDDDRSIVVGTAEGIVALDALTGGRRWRWLATAGEDPTQLRASAVTPDGRRLLVTSSLPIRRVLDTGSGTLLVSENADPLRPDPGAARAPAWRIAAATVAGDVEVIDVANGRTLEAFPVPGGVVGHPGVLGHPELSQDQLAIGLPGGVVTTRSLGAETATWTTEVTPAADCRVVAGGGTVLVAGDPPRALDAGDGARRWTAEGDVATAGDVAAAAGQVVSVDVRGSVTATDAVSGEVLWRSSAGGDPLGSPALADGIVVVAGGRGIGGDWSGYVRALSAEDGTRRWFRTTDGPLYHPPVVTDGLVVVATSRSVQGFDLASGDDRWRVALDAPPAASPALTSDAMVVTTAADVATYDLRGGDPQESARTSLPVPLVRAPVVINGVIVLRLDAATVLGMDRWSHDEYWRATIADDVLTTPPTVVGDRVLVGGQAGVHVLDPTSSGRRTELVAVGPLVGRISVTDAGMVTCGADGELLSHG